MTRRIMVEFCYTECHKFALHAECHYPDCPGTLTSLSPLLAFFPAENAANVALVNAPLASDLAPINGDGDNKIKTDKNRF